MLQQRLYIIFRHIRVKHSQQRASRPKRIPKADHTTIVIESISLMYLPIRSTSHCPPEYRAETSRMVEQVLKGYAVLQAAQGSARTLTELELRRVDGELARRGVEPDAESHYQASPARPTSMKTDFRA